MMQGTITEDDLARVAKMLGDIASGKSPEANERLNELARQAIAKMDDHELSAEEIEAWASRLANDLVKFTD